MITFEEASFALIAAVLVASALASALVKRTFHSVMFLGVFLVTIAALYILLGSPLVGIIQILVYVGGILTLFVFAVMFVAGDETEVTEAQPSFRPRSPAWQALAGAVIGAAVLVAIFTLTGRVNGLVTGLLGGGDWARFAGFLAGLAFIGAAAIGGLLAWLAVRRVLDTWSAPRLFGTAVAGALAVPILMLAMGVSICATGICVDAAHPWTGAVATDQGVADANALESILASLFGPQVVAFEVLGVLLTAVMIGALVIARPMAAPLDEERYAVVTRAQLAESQQVSAVPEEAKA